MITRQESSWTRRAAYLAATLVVSGCGSRYSEYCEARAECLNKNDEVELNDADIEACIADREGREDEAAAYDCSEDYDALAECVLEDASCEENDGRSVWSYDCEDEVEDYAECVDDASKERIDLD